MRNLSPGRNRFLTRGLRPAVVAIAFLAFAFAFGCGDGSNGSGAAVDAFGGDAPSDEDNDGNAGDDGDAADDDAPTPDPGGDDDSESDDDDVGAAGVIWTYDMMDAGVPAPNPIHDAETPAELNRIPYMRFRAETGENPPLAATAVLVLIPGFTVGAGSLGYLATSLVQLSGGDIEVWVMDRRHHLLEDQRGFDAAEAAGDPRIAYDYYFGGGEIDGHKFAGILDAKGSATDFMTEWTLELELRDLRRLIRTARAAQPAAAIFLGGHSRGVMFTRAFAAMEFDDGHLGCEELAGIVMLDGEGRYDPDLNEAGYKENIDRLRRGRDARFESFPPLGPTFYLFGEILAMAATRGFGDPDDPEVGADKMWTRMGPFASFLPLLYRFHDITITNEALAGFLLDNDTSIVPLVRANFGFPEGPVGHDFIGYFPNDPNTTYTWRHFDRMDPPEVSHIQNLMPWVYRGPTDAVDPYYGARTSIDLKAADRLDTEGTWRDKYFRFRTSRMDAPVFGIATRMLIERADNYSEYRDMLPPARGQNRPRTQFGFEVISRPTWEHMDPVIADAATNDFYPALIDWMRRFSKDAPIGPAAE
ncbi:hypothetical protein K8I61_19420 [bacterium]|nr:hypothetical protein [bacterium]